MVGARKGIGVSDESEITIVDGLRHRISHAWINGMVKGGVHVFSIYAKDIIGPVGENLRLMEELTAALRAIDGPWIISGDWNMTPETLRSTGWPQMVKGTIVATELPTCNGSSYDFFLVSQCLRHAVMGVQRIKDAGLQPHFPVRLLLRGNARRLAIRKLVKAPKVYGVLPHGPLNETQDYSKVTQLAKEGKITAAMRAWHEMARDEWSCLASADLKHKEHKFRWESAAGRMASEHPGKSFASRLWRYAATTAKEAQLPCRTTAGKGF